MRKVRLAITFAIVAAVVAGALPAVADEYQRTLSRWMRGGFDG